MDNVIETELNVNKKSLLNLENWIGSGVEADRVIAYAIIEVARALNLQTESHLQMELERRLMYPKVSFANLPKPDFTSMLVEATEKRDKLMEQIEKLENTVLKMPEDMQDFLLATSKAPLVMQLEEVEKYVSYLHGQIEKGN